MQTSEVTVTDEEVYAEAMLLGIEVTKIGFAWQAGCSNALDLELFASTVRIREYDPAQEPEDDDMV